MVALLVLSTVLLFLTVDYFVRRRRALQVTAGEREYVAPVVAHDPEYRSPHGVFFDPHHVWAFLEESGSALVGVDDLTRVVMGRIDRVDIVPAGKRVRRGEKLLELFHGNRSVTVRSPFDGVVEEVKDQVARATHDGALTSDWLCKIRPSDTSAFQQTMMLGEKASDWLKREVRRLRVFLSTVASEHPVLAQTAHDGGMPYAGMAEYLSDRDWRKLRETFFDDLENGTS